MEPNPFIEEQYLEEVEEEIRRRNAASSLLDYETYVHPHYKVSKFHKYLCNTVQKFLETDTGHSIDVLLLSVPPQFGKSTTITETVPAWSLGKHPEKKWIIASYNSEFASTFGRKNKQKCEESFHNARKVNTSYKHTERQNTS